MKVFNGIADLQGAVGADLGVSDWHTVTQKQIDLFADVTGDQQWIHVDPEAASRGPFGVPIAHGLLTLSLLPMATNQIWKIDGVKMAVNYGFNRVRFPSVLKVNERVRVGARLTAVRATGAGTQITVTATVEVEGRDKPACVAEWVLVLAA